MLSFLLLLYNRAYCNFSGAFVRCLKVWIFTFFGVECQKGERMKESDVIYGDNIERNDDDENEEEVETMDTEDGAYA